MNYTVGDTVGYCRSGRYGLMSSGFGTVEKVNGHGHVFLKTPTGTERFDKFGDSYKNSYGPKLIGAARLTEILEREENARNIDRATRELSDVVTKRRCGSGGYNMDAETLDTIDAMVKKLRDMVG
jgi:hypothetical protein